MRNPFCLTLMLAFSISISNAQSKPVPAASFGFRTGINSSNFKLVDFSEGVSTKGKIELVSGLFANFPITSTFSIQPELLYSVMGADIIRPDSAIATTHQKLGYLSVPLQAKIKVSKSFSLLAGPQFDFLTAASSKTDEHSVTNKEEISKNDFALTGGIEYSPLPKFLVTARYIHGLKNVPRDQVEGSYFNRGFQLTIAIRFGNYEHVESKPKVVSNHINPDEDKDGVNDLDDKCPLVAGSVKYNGCPIPDSDNDGINDEEDKCPNEAGAARYQGCPVPDTDKDGINDENDQCPEIAGLTSNNGCPAKDRDADGVPDDIDNCPDLVGTAASNGCPVIETKTFKASLIEFLSGSVTLTAKAKEALDEGAALLQSEQFAPLKIQIEGYTDNTGKERSNIYISQKRANVVKSYLVSKGVAASRITAIGYGSKSPIADNATAQGRSRNRRVEFKVSQ
jgi:outer membrane protein OmpA-like peptidoglycan-associated protein